MFHSEELKEEAKAFLSSPSRNTLLKNCCQFRNSEIAIRLLNLQNETIAENEDRVITFFYCIQNNLKEVAELILSNEKNPEKWIRGEGKIEENNVIAAFAKPIFLDLVIPMAEMIDSSNPHLIFHFCHEMIMASSLHQDSILDWMVSHYHIPTYFVMDPDLNTIYSYLAINGKTEHFKTLYGREIGSSPELLMMNKSESNPLLYSIQHKNHEIAIFILENLKLENQSMMDLMMQYQKMAMKNKSPKSLLVIFEKKIREIRYFEKMKRQKENDELQKILTEMGEIIDTPKKVVKPVVISPPPVSTKNKRIEKANEVSDMEMAMILTGRNVPKPPKQESPIANKADVKKPVKEAPVSPPKKVKPEKKRIENPKPVDFTLKTDKEVISPKKEEDIQRPVVEISNIKENFILDCEKTDPNYLNQLSYVILDSLGIYE